MKKVLFILFAVMATSAIAQAQDLITTKDGKDIFTKVLEITPDEVKYKLYDEPGGVTYIVKKSDILLIRYESGRNEVFTEESIWDEYYYTREPVQNLRPNMKYRELLTLYDHRDYTRSFTDRYSPAWTGVASAFIPGLGQCINGEWGRGLATFFGNVALMSFAQSNCYEDASEVTQGFAVACYAAAVGLNIWSVVDAVRIARVKNMYEQDLRQTYSMDIDLYPSVNFVKVGNSFRPIAGFSFALNF